MKGQREEYEDGARKSRRGRQTDKERACVRERVEERVEERGRERKKERERERVS